MEASFLFQDVLGNTRAYSVLEQVGEDEQTTHGHQDTRNRPTIIIMERVKCQSQVRRGLVFPYPGHHLEKERSLHLVGNLQKRDGSLDPSNLTDTS